MAKIKLKGDISGSRNGEDWPPRGTVVDLPDDEADQLVRSGMAEPAEKDADVHPFGKGSPHVVAQAPAEAPVETAADEAPVETRPAAAAKKA